MNNRINWIDWAKYIGIYLVVLGHFQPAISGSYTTSIQYEIIYAFHLPLFFFLSGYLQKTESNFKELILKNFRTLIIPYILLNICVYILLIPYYLICDTSLTKPIIAFFLGSGNAPAGACWFLVCLFFVKILFFILIKYRPKVQILITVTAPLICYLLIWIFDFNFPLRFMSALMAIPFFMGGYCLRHHNTLENSINRTLSILLLICLTPLLVILGHVNGLADMQSCWFGNNILLFYINAVIGCSIVVIACKLLDNIQHKFIQIISSGTLIIMAFHANRPYLTYKPIFKLTGPFEPTFIMHIAATLFILAIFYYPIIYVQKHCPVLIGGRKLIT